MIKRISYFKRRTDSWRREQSNDDFIMHMQPDAMHREIQALVNDGWRIEREEGRCIVLEKKVTRVCPYCGDSAGVSQEDGSYRPHNCN